MLLVTAATCRDTGRARLSAPPRRLTATSTSTSLPRLRGRVPPDAPSGKEERSLMDWEPFMERYPI